MFKIPQPDQPVLLQLDGPGTGGKLGNERSIHTHQFMAGIAFRRRWCPQFALCPEFAVQFVVEQPVVVCAGCHDRFVEGAGVQRGPGPVAGPLDAVGDHEVGVQLRVPGP